MQTLPLGPGHGGGPEGDAWARSLNPVRRPELGLDPAPGPTSQPGKIRYRGSSTNRG